MVYFAYICLFLLLISKRHMCNNQFINRFWIYWIWVCIYRYIMTLLYNQPPNPTSSPQYILKMIGRIVTRESNPNSTTYIIFFLFCENVVHFIFKKNAVSLSYNTLNRWTTTAVTQSLAYELQCSCNAHFSFTISHKNAFFFLQTKLCWSIA